MLIKTEQGLYCPAGKFHIDPKGAVEHAVITHAHSDHARKGSQRYYCSSACMPLLKARLGENTNIAHFPYREKFVLNGIPISFHPAGHILGSSQIRIEFTDQVWVVSGDYKRAIDPTCDSFEVVPCDVFISEATFGTPSFVWNKTDTIAMDIYDWWLANAEQDHNSVLLAYTLGKTQRILNLLAGMMTKPIICDPAASRINACYQAANIPLAETVCLSQLKRDAQLTDELFIVPPSFLHTERAGIIGSAYRTAFASGWMSRSYNNYDKGFVLSDHADWNELLQTILETKAKRIYVQHRGNGALVKKLRSLGLQAFSDAALLPQFSKQLTLF